MDQLRLPRLAGLALGFLLLFAAGALTGAGTVSAAVGQLAFLAAVAVIVASALLLAQRH